MHVNDFLADLDDLAETGRFFVALAERLPDDKGAEEDLTRLAHSLRIPIPRELRGASIETVADNHRIGDAADSTTVVITYPPVPTPDPQTVAMSFKKCFTICKTVSGAKVCATVCVKIDVGITTGVHGTIKATVEVTF